MHGPILEGYRASEEKLSIHAGRWLMDNPFLFYYNSSSGLSINQSAISQSVVHFEADSPHVVYQIAYYFISRSLQLFWKAQDPPQHLSRYRGLLNSAKGDASIQARLSYGSLLHHCSSWETGTQSSPMSMSDWRWKMAQVRSLIS